MASELHVDSIKHSGGTSAMTIDSSGRVLKSNIPYFHVTGNDGWVDLGSSFVAFFMTGTQAVDIISNVGSHYDASNGRFTAPVAGMYQFSCFMYVNNTGDASHPSRVYLNGSHWHDNYHVQGNADDYSDHTLAYSWNMNLSATDYVNVFAQEDYYGHHCHWMGYLAG